MLPNRDSSALFGPELAKNKGRCQRRAESGGWQRTKGIFKTAIPLEIPPTAGCQELTAVLSSLEATHYHAWQDNWNDPAFPSHAHAGVEVLHPRSGMGERPID